MKHVLCLVACIALAVNGLRAQIPTDGLMAYYPFSLNTKDLTGNGHDGSATNIVFVNDRFGEPGNAGTFYGSSVDCGDWHPHVNSFAVSLWFTTANYNSSRSTLICDAGGLRGFLMYQSANLLLFEIQGFEAVSEVTYSLSPSDENQWIHAVGVSNNGILELFINGNLVAWESCPPADDGMNLFGIGFESGTASNYWHGNIDDVRLYDRPLSSTEVQALYAEEKTDIIELSVSSPFSEINDFYRGDWILNRFVFDITLSKALLPDPPIKDIAIEASLDGQPLRLELNNSRCLLDRDADSVIDQLPAVCFPSKDSISFLAFSPSYDDNQNKKPLVVRITSIGGKPTTIVYKDSVSLQFAKHPVTGRPYYDSTDSYRFGNLGALTFSEMRQWLVGRSFVTGPITLGLAMAWSASGRCFGMAGTAARYFLHQGLKPLPGDVFDWPSSNVLVRDNITLSQLAQILPWYEPTFDLDEQWAVLQETLAMNKPAPLFMKQAAGGRNHVVLATKITSFQNASTSYVQVYDSNHPMEYNRKTAAKIDHTAKRFSYDGLYGCMSVIDESIYSVADVRFAFNKALASIANGLFAGSSEAFLTACPVNLLVVDEAGFRAGYLGTGELVNEISGSTILRLPTDDSPGDSVTAVYVPSTGRYHAVIAGNAPGLLHFEHVKASASDHLYACEADSVPVTANTICYFSESDSAHFYVDSAGSGQLSAIVTKIHEITVGVDASIRKAALPTLPLLTQNCPNPFNPSTTISYALPRRSHVTLTVFNTLGQQVATLVNAEKEAGTYETIFEASGLASGVYLYRLQAGEYVKTRKLILLR